MFWGVNVLYARCLILSKMWALNEHFHLWHLLCFPLQPPCVSLLLGEPEVTQLLLAVSLSAFHPEKWVLCLKHPKGGWIGCFVSFWILLNQQRFFLLYSLHTSENVTQYQYFRKALIGNRANEINAKLQNSGIHHSRSIDFTRKMISWVTCHFQHFLL